MIPPIRSPFLVSTLIALTLSLTASLAGAADTAPPAAAAPAAATASKAAMADGEIRKIDREGGKLTLKHGEIRNLDMPPMTMVFRVQDPALLATLKEGDKVRFAAERVGGNITVTAIEAAR